MKKVISALILVLTLVFVCLSASAFDPFYNDIEIRIDNAVLDSRDINGNVVQPFIVNGSTYLPVRAIGGAFNIDIDWDNDTRTVYIGEKGGNPVLKDQVNIFIDQQEFVAKDASGNVVYPIIVNGSTYLPVRAIGEAFGKIINWESDENGLTKTVFIDSKKSVEVAHFDENQTYKITVKGLDYAFGPLNGSDELSAGIDVVPFTGAQYQLFKFVKAAGSDEYYSIVNAQTGYVLDMRNGSTAPGTDALLYTNTNGDHQLFKIMTTEDGYYKIYPKHSNLPLEYVVGAVLQNEERSSDVQKWSITPAQAVEVSDDDLLIKKLVVASSKKALATTNGTALGLEDPSNTPKQDWYLVATTDDSYLISSSQIEASLDVEGASMDSGAKVLLWETHGNANQCWIFEIQDDGSYFIKSVNSSLYLAVSENELIQSGTPTAWLLEDIK